MNKRLEKVLGDVLNNSDEIIFQNEEEFKTFRKKAKVAAKKYSDSQRSTSMFNGIRLETPVIYPASYKITVKVEDAGWISYWKIEGTVKCDLHIVEHFLKNINKNTAKSFIQNLGPDYRF